MSTPILSRHFADEAATASFAQRIAPLLRPGDTLLLSGEIGAGKSTFARALIRARLNRMEDVPSPTFTLVQVYDAPNVEIWHCDLYRLTDTSEVFELGLDEAFTTAICLIEWPDRLGSEAPAESVTFAFVAGVDGHDLTVTGSNAWHGRLADV